MCRVVMILCLASYLEVIKREKKTIKFMHKVNVNIYDAFKYLQIEVIMLNNNVI